MRRGGTWRAPHLWSGTGLSEEIAWLETKRTGRQESGFCQCVTAELGKLPVLLCLQFWQKLEYRSVSTLGSAILCRRQGVCISHHKPFLVTLEKEKRMVSPAASGQQCHVNQLLMIQSVSVRLMKDTEVIASPFSFLSSPC